MKNTLEIACFDATHVKQISITKADRIELCSNVNVGGVTPDYDDIILARKNTNLPLYIMIRPRGGNFIYSYDELELMKADIAFCKKNNSNGVVFGLLNENGNIDIENAAKLVEISKPLDITFHRAFDVCSNPFKAIDDLISLGIKRVLTSGQKATAVEGKFLLCDLIKYANGRIEIMAGGGVNAENTTELFDVGIRSFHASAHKLLDEKMICDEEKINAIINVISRVS